jgi:hypothetical protein
MGILPNINYPDKCDLRYVFRSQRWDNFIVSIETPRKPDGTSEKDFYITNVASSENIITVSQADQALGDEAEAGRIHGKGKFFCGLWENGNIRINLHEPWYPCDGYFLSLEGGLSF